MLETSRKPDTIGHEAIDVGDGHSDVLILCV